MKVRHANRHSAALPGRKRLLRLLAVASGLLTIYLHALPCLAENGITLVDCASPLNRQVRSGFWSQLVATLENQTAEDQSAKLVFPTSSESAGLVNFCREAWLPARSRVKLSMPTRMGDLPVDLQQSERISVSLQQARLENLDSIEMLDQRMEFQFLPLNRKLLLIALDEATEPSALSYLGDPELGQRVLPSLTIARPRFADLPDRWLGYQAVSLLLIGELRPGQLRPAQDQAIADWVRQGGALVFFAADGTEALLSTPLGRMAGVSAGDAGVVDHLTVTDAEGNPQCDVTLSTPARMLALTPSDASVLYHASGLPLITHRRAGLGHVFVLAVPSGALAQADLVRLWRRVYLESTVPAALAISMPVDAAGERTDADNFRQCSLDALRQIDGRKGLGRGAILLWLGGFVVLTAGAGILLGRLGRAELTWAMALPVGLALAVGFAIQAGRMKTPARLSSVGLVVLDETGRAAARQATAFYSPAEVQDLTVSAGAPTGAVFPLGATGAKGQSVSTVWTAGPLEMRSVRVAENSAPAFETAATLDEPGLSADLTFGPGGIEGIIRNETPQDLEDVILLQRGAAYRIGRLASGTATPVEIGAEDRLANNEFVPSAIKGRQERLQSELLASLVTPAITNEGRRDGRPFLVGWRDAMPMPPGGDLADTAKDAMTLLAMPLTIEAPGPGTRVSLAREFLDTRFDAVGQGLWSQRTGFLERRENGAIDIVADLPPNLSRLNEATATVTVGINAPAYRLLVLGPAGGEEDGVEERIESFDGPLGALRVEVPQAERFTNERGTIRIRLKVESLEPLPKDPVKRPTWTFHAIAIEREGIAP